MIQHPFTLEHVALALHQRLQGARLVEAWTQEKYRATLVFQQDNTLHLYVIDVSPDGGSIIERSNERRARSNTINILDGAMLSSLACVTKQPDDRIITFWFESIQVHVELFTGGRGNIVVVRDGNVIESLRENSERKNTAYTVRVFESPKPFLDPLATCLRSLSSSNLRLGPHYAEEVCHRSGIDPDALVNSLTDKEVSSCLQNALQLFEEAHSAKLYYHLSRESTKIFSLIPLRGWSIVEEYDNILEALSATIRDRKRTRGISDKRKVMLKTGESEVRRLQRSIDGMTRDAATDSRSDRYRTWADVILSQGNVSQSGLDVLEYTDEDGSMISIPLNQKLTLIENAQSLYSKARASATAAKSRNERLPQIMAKLDMANERLNRIYAATTNDDLEHGATNVTTETISLRDEANGKFRVFVIDDAHTLYVGKNAANNDELTMRFAKQNDWWMHARGSAGSHAVLRGVTTDKISKSVLEKAAAITAYYSQARNASYVPVVYTQRKYVRKPKGANIGAVSIEREHTVMVKPSLPSDVSE